MPMCIDAAGHSQTMNHNSMGRRGRRRLYAANQDSAAIPRHADHDAAQARFRGSARQVFEKYVSLARDAFADGDRVAAENFLQHAEHYFRVMHAEQTRRADADERDFDPTRAGGGSGR